MCHCRKNIYKQFKTVTWRMWKWSSGTGCVFCVVLVVVCCIYHTKMIEIGGMLVWVCVVSWNSVLYVRPLYLNLYHSENSQGILNFIRPDVFHIKTKYNLFCLTHLYPLWSIHKGYRCVRRKRLYFVLVKVFVINSVYCAVVIVSVLILETEISVFW